MYNLRFMGKPCAPLEDVPLTPGFTWGPRATAHGVHFTLFCRHARRLWLLLFDRPDDENPCLEITLDPQRHRRGDTWHVFVPGARPGQAYVYRAAGPERAVKGACYHPEQWLLDPCAPAIAGHAHWGDAAEYTPGNHPLRGRGFPRGLIMNDSFDWQGDRPPRIPLEQTVLYEVHVRGFTVAPSAGVVAPGTYRGLIEKIPYLKDLGITAVELLPVHEFNELEFQLEQRARKHLRNYWGYSTLGFFAPNGRYAAGGVGGAQVREFQELVRALHGAGMEVILDVVFNHTAESDAAGPVYSFRGIDAPVYYLLDPRNGHPVDYTGCGNTVQCQHPVVREFITQCLRHWVLHMHVDGFRFDLASIFYRDRNGRPLEHAPLVEQLAEDPVLRDCKLIAEPWDAAGLFQLGRFYPSRWREWNSRFAEDARRFWRGDKGRLRPLAERLCGSPDLFRHAGARSTRSINYITCHDGFTLQDLVSYHRKHNRDNAENNRDGADENFSDNCGTEGPTEDPDIQARRQRRVRNLLATLMAARGVPMLLAGDEFGRTQRGNNNAYCQDNPISWVDWRLLPAGAGLHAFVRDLLRLRREQPALQTLAFPSRHDVEWLGEEGAPPDWEHGHALGLLTAAGTGHALCVLFNQKESAAIFAPPRGAAAWRLCLHSAAPGHPSWEGDRLRVPAESVAFLGPRSAAAQRGEDV